MVSPLPVVSVIVPVYNAEKFLHCCIDSILAQTFIDWELLLIDDGSKDASGRICDEYAARDERIRVIHKENTGVSDTRNKGLDVARGKYLFFLDADDFWLRTDCMSLFVQKAEEHDLDIVRGEYSAMNEDGTFAWSREIPKKRKGYAEKVLNNVEFLEYGIHEEFFLPLSMFKRSRMGNLRLEKGRIFLEDMLFYSIFLLQDLKCMYLPDMRFYAYRKNEGSASNQVSVKKLEDTFSMCYCFHELALQAQNPILKEIYVNKSIMMYSVSLSTMAWQTYYPKRKVLIAEFKLNTLLRDIRNWMKESSRTFFSPIYYVSPAVGVTVYFLLQICYVTMYRLKVFIMSSKS